MTERLQADAQLRSLGINPHLSTFYNHGLLSLAETASGRWQSVTVTNPATMQQRTERFVNGLAQVAAPDSGGPPEPGTKLQYQLMGQSGSKTIDLVVTYPWEYPGEMGHGGVFSLCDVLARNASGNLGYRGSDHLDPS